VRLPSDGKKKFWREAGTKEKRARPIFEGQRKSRGIEKKKKKKDRRPIHWKGKPGEKKGQERFPCGEKKKGLVLTVKLEIDSPRREKRGKKRGAGRRRRVSPRERPPKAGERGGRLFFFYCGVNSPPSGGK